MDTREYSKLEAVEDRMWYFRSLHRQVLDRVVPSLPRGAAVLDAGCGTGGLLRALSARRPDLALAGVDLSPLACAPARARCGPGVKLAVGSVTALPFGSARFDAVVSVDVVCQVDDPGAALAELRRVLKPGGLLVTNVPAYRWLWSYHDETCRTRHRFGRAELVRLLERAGFASIATTHWNALALPAIWARRKLLPQGPGASDVEAFHPLLDALFGGLVGIELAWRGLGGSWAWGSSLFGSARAAGP